MSFMQRLLFFVIILVSPLYSTAQTMAYFPDTSIKVFAYGQQQTLAWCGGFNNPQFAMGDLNNDGLQDLVVFETYNGVRTFINKGTPGNPVYRYAPEYALNFPPVMDYLVLSDYNCDGIPDLFHQGSTGIAAYYGYYNASNQLCFGFYKELFYNNDVWAGGWANAFNNPGDIPAIVDVDHDGDLDFVSYDILGGNMNFYKNMRVELGLPCDSIHIELKDRCWGRVFQGFYRTHELAYSCDESGLLRSSGSGEKKTHQGNTPCLFDWDMDGDYDYLDGSISFNQMTFLTNGRMEYNPTGADSMVYQDTMWQSVAGGTEINLPIWPAAFNVDIDQDGKKDLLIAPNSGNTCMNYNNIWYYKNFTTTPGVPDWRFQSDSFLIDKSIDLGTAANPMLFDFNKDGRPDLFVGSDGYRQSNGLLKSRLSYYLNTSTVGNPSLTLQTDDFLGLNSYGFQGIAPAFGDIDFDGKADMIIGHDDGSLSYFKNMAASDLVAPGWVLSQLQLTDYNGVAINVGSNAAPYIYDIDRDGKKDLVIGSTNGYIVYYQNISTVPGTIALKLVNKKLGKAKVDPRQNIGVYSTPFFGKIDTSGQDYLLMGSNSGNIYRFTGFQSGDTTAIYTMLDSQYSFIDTAHLVYNNPASANGLYGSHRSALTVGDICGNGNLEMIVGNVKGGVNLYKSTLASSLSASVYEQGKVLVYPNPAKDLLSISWSGTPEPDVHIDVINVEGQSLYTTVIPAVVGHTTIPLASLPSGMYICVLQSGVNRYYSKFTVIR